jgi:hypothetical protein
LLCQGNAEEHINARRQASNFVPVTDILENVRSFGNFKGCVKSLSVRLRVRIEVTGRLFFSYRLRDPLQVIPRNGVLSARYRYSGIKSSVEAKIKHKRSNRP